MFKVAFLRLKAETPNYAMQRSALVITPLATGASGAPTARRR
jgi:hypothetical protein